MKKVKSTKHSKCTKISKIMNDDTGTKKCVSCDQEKPKTKEFFYSNGKKGASAGFRSSCKLCEKARKDARPKKTYKPITSGRKICKGILCNGKKISVSKFNKDKSKIDGLQSICRNCQRSKARANITITDDLTKKCFSNKPTIISCSKIKPLNEFSKNPHGKFGYHNQCNKCRSKNRKRINVKPQKNGTKICKGSQCLKINQNGVEKNVKEFHSDKRNVKNGLQSTCKVCRKYDSVKHYSKLKNYCKLLIKDTKSNLKRKARQLKLEITVNDIEKLYNSQNRRCAISGIEMQHSYTISNDKKTHIKRPYNISIDRVDSNKGYTLKNIQLVCSIINRMKYKLKNETFIKFCDLVANFNIEDEPTHTKFEYSNDIKKYISTKYCDMRCNVDKRAKIVKIKISKDDILNLNIEQNGCCALSGVQLTYILGTKTKEQQHNFSRHNMSIDRKDSNGHYTIENVQLVCAAINYMKSDLSDGRFIELCKIITKHNSHEQKIIKRCENILKNSTIHETSNEYKNLINKQSTLTIHHLYPKVPLPSSIRDRMDALDR